MTSSVSVITNSRRNSPRSTFHKRENRQWLCCTALVFFSVLAVFQYFLWNSIKEISFPEPKWQQETYNESLFQVDPFFNLTLTHQEFCPAPAPNLMGSLNITLSVPKTLEAIRFLHPGHVDAGGRYKPPECKSKDKVAILIPFRDREEQLRIFLFNILPVLQRQLIEYNIFVIEQADENPFNRASLFNVGFVEARKLGEFDCFILHDVDRIPENDFNLYNCPTQPRLMSVTADVDDYQPYYESFFGGVSALTTEHFLRLNGFSNSFWGWGGEDDDMAARIAHAGLFITRDSPGIARYTMLPHEPQKPNNNRWHLLQTGSERFSVDGLSNLNYTLEEIDLQILFTRFRVQLSRLESTS